MPHGMASSEPRVCIIGAGAVGTFIGARLARAGCRVTALARGATAVSLRAHGFRLVMDGALVSAPVAVVEGTTGVGEQDLVVLAVKGPSLAGVAPSVRPALGAHTRVLTAMNGVPWWFFQAMTGPCGGLQLQSIDPGGRIGAAIPPRHIIGGVVHATCSVSEPGLVRHGFGNGLIVGEPDGSRSPRLEALAARLTAAGLDVTVSSRVQAGIWYKLWGNMTMNPISALTGATRHPIPDQP